MNNQPNHTDFIENILILIDYKDDKSAMAEKLVSECHRAALANWIKDHPQDETTYNGNNLQDLMLTMEYQALFESMFIRIMKLYIRNLAPVLSDKQLQKLEDYFTKLQP